MSDWKDSAHKRRQQQSQSIPVAWRLNQNYLGDWRDSRPVIESCGILTAEELIITSITNASQLSEEIHSRTWTSEAVATAFCKRAAIAQQLTGCCTEMFFDEAIKQAKSQDEYLARTGRTVGPLHGIPLSLKDSHEVEGHDTTLGWVGLLNKPAIADNVAVSQYRSLGAILYCKTNIPQSLMMSDSYNHLFGQSLNALNRHLISGGSSGGEGAILGAKGSIIGIGTDIGGSIRIPAILQSLYGLCPSRGRMPNRESGRHQKHLIPPVAGPMATSLSSIEFFMSSYLSPTSCPWLSDPEILPIPWRHELATPQSHKLKIAYILDDGFVRPHPPITRALQSTISLLTSAGHTVFPWPHTSSHSQAYHDLWLPSILSDGGQRCADLCALHNEPLIPGMLVGQPSDRLDVAQRQELAEKIWAFQKQYLDWWTASGVDALIMPAVNWVGMRPKQWVQSKQYCGLTAVWNLLDYACLAVPTGTVNREEDGEVDEEWKSHRGRNESDTFNHGLYEELRAEYEGMPVGMQIVTGRFGEERAVAVAKVIEELRRKEERRKNGKEVNGIESEDVHGMRDASKLIEGFVDSLVQQLPEGLRGQNKGENRAKPYS